MDLKDLYRDVIIDHNRHPRNLGVLTPADATAQGHNPLCGDQLTIRLRYSGTGAAQRVSDIQFEGSGCAISMASASLLTEAVKGKSRSEIEQLYTQMHALLTQHQTTIDLATLGKLAALSGVHEFPARVKCASLCWHTLNAALQHDSTPVSTE